MSYGEHETGKPKDTPLRPLDRGDFCSPRYSQLVSEDRPRWICKDCIMGLSAIFASRSLAAIISASWNRHSRSAGNLQNLLACESFLA